MSEFHGHSRNGRVIAIANQKGGVGKTTTAPTQTTAKQKAA